MSQMSLVIDRTPHCLSERSLLSIYSKEGEGGEAGVGGGGVTRDRMPGQHMVTFWTQHVSLPSRVGNELLWVAHT